MAVNLPSSGLSYSECGYGDGGMFTTNDYGSYLVGGGSGTIDDPWTEDDLGNVSGNDPYYYEGNAYKKGDYILLGGKPMLLSDYYIDEAGDKVYTWYNEEGSGNIYPTYLVAVDPTKYTLWEGFNGNANIFFLNSVPLDAGYIGMILMMMMAVAYGCFLKCRDMKNKA